LHVSALHQSRRRSASGGGSLPRLQPSYFFAKLLPNPPFLGRFLDSNVGRRASERGRRGPRRPVVRTHRCHAHGSSTASGRIVHFGGALRQG
jgi:hypothetical protein